MGEGHTAVLDFAVKYPGWHGFNPCCLDTVNSVRYLESLELIEISPTNQFRAIVK